MEDYNLRDSLMSRNFRESSFATLGMCLAFAWDFILDHIDNLMLSPKKNEENEGTKKIVVDSEKFMFFLGVLVIPALALLPTSTYGLALSYVCACSSQQILIGGFTVVMCSRYYKSYFPLPLTVFTLVSFISTTVVQAWIMNLSYTFDDRRFIAFVLQLFSFIPFVLCSFYWLYCEFILRLLVPRVRQIIHTVRQKGKNNSRSDGLEKQHERHSEDLLYFPIWFAGSAIAFLVLLAIIGTIAPNFFDMGPGDLMMINLPGFLFQISMMVFSAQYAKYEAVEYLYKLLDSKKSYVRYISHELRTPMNTACLGLGMLLAEGGHILEDGTEEERAQFETFSDINVACNTAVDILNDLLSFEKLESGILELYYRYH